MIFEKGVRHGLLKPYEQSLDVPETDNLIFERGVLDTQKRRGVDENMASEMLQYKYPDQFILRVKIKGIPFKNDMTYVQIYSNGYMSSNVHFYGQGILENDHKTLGSLSQYSAVDIVFTGHIFLCDKEGIHPFQSDDFLFPFRKDQAVYRKTFLTESSLMLIQKQERLQEGIWMIDPPYGASNTLNQLVLLPYGGYVGANSFLQNIDQVFASIEPVYGDNHPRLLLWKKRDLLDQNIDFDLGGYVGNIRYVYARQMTADQKLSLAGVIESGLITFKISPSQMPEEQQEYVSYYYNQNDPSTGYVDIYFQRA